MLAAFIGIAVAAVFLWITEDPSQQPIIGIAAGFGVILLLAIRFVYIPYGLRGIRQQQHSLANYQQHGDEDIQGRASAPASPLIRAIRDTQSPEAIRGLLEDHADLEAVDENGWTALRWAAAYNQNPDVVGALVEAGARLEARDPAGMTALMYAAWVNQNPEVVVALLKAGADAKARNSSNKTALDYARDNRTLQGTEALQRLENASQ